MTASMGQTAIDSFNLERIQVHVQIPMQVSIDEGRAYKNKADSTGKNLL